MHRPRGRQLIGLAAAVAVVAPLGWMWQDSLVPSTYSVMEMGHHDYGGGPVPAEGAHAMHGSAAGGASVATLTGPTGRKPDVAVTLTARKGPFRLASGERVTGYTLNGTSPGPLVRATQGDLVEVTLVNESVPDGVTLHWHGVDVPNAEDGVAGVTQDAVGRGERHVYRFVAEDAGTYWYHSHQVSHVQVRKGLYGALVVLPRPAGPGGQDVVLPVHTYDGRVALDGRVGERRVVAAPGERVRLRVINTNSRPLRTWVTGGPYRLLAVDGRDVHEPADTTDLVVIAAGGRGDLEVRAPSDGSAVRVDLGGGTSFLAVGPADARMPASVTPRRELDLLRYGSPASVGFDVDAPARRFDYRIGRRPGFLDGRPGFWWTVNGRLFPDVPMYVVEEGDVVRMRIKNSSGDVHPMHLHGHHAVVVSRNGKRATGSPWWVDSLNVKNGETYEIAFVADNPGVWMDHCHNLPHARDGLIAHLMYAGVETPYVVGGGSDNTPE